MACSKACVDRAIRGSSKARATFKKLRTQAERLNRSFAGELKKFGKSLAKVEGFASPTGKLLSVNDYLVSDIEKTARELRAVRKHAKKR
jgi:hypothetical protein